MPISSTPTQAYCSPYAERSRRQGNTSCGDAPGSMRRDKTCSEGLPLLSRSLPSTLEGWWCSQWPSFSKAMPLKPQHQTQSQAYAVQVFKICGLIRYIGLYIEHTCNHQTSKRNLFCQLKHRYGLSLQSKQTVSFILIFMVSA